MEGTILIELRPGRAPIRYVDATRVEELRALAHVLEHVAEDIDHLAAKVDGLAAFERLLVDREVDNAS